MKKVVIVGGGFAGARCAKSLDRDFDVTLVDTKPYFEYTPGILRTIVEPNHAMKVQAMHGNYLKNGKIVVGKIQEIGDKEVFLKNGTVPYDYLVITSGSSYNSPIKEEGLVPATRAAELVEFHEKLDKANTVLVIGGGLVGVELVAEICTHYKDKEIILVHSREELIDRNNEKSKKYVEKFLRKHGVKIIFGDRGKKKKENILITEKGREIKADIMFMCVGIKSNYEFMEKMFGEKLNARKQVKVNDFMQVKGCNNIFAGGDIVGIDEEKIAQGAERHADIIVKNIRNLENRKDLVKYEHKRRPMLISLGKYDCVFEDGKFVMTGLIPGLLKGFVEWKTMFKYR